MKAFWNDCGQGLESDSAKEVGLKEAGLIWSDEVHGVEGNFFGLIDDQGNTIQFYFDDGIPDHIEDARHLAIVLMDFPMPERKGSFSARVTIGEVHSLIERHSKRALTTASSGKSILYPGRVAQQPTNANQPVILQGRAFQTERT